MELASLLGKFRLDRSRSATVQVYEQLRALIVTLALKPGTILSRVELAEGFGISQTPIREALARLDEELLVEVFPQHHTRVRGIDLNSARQAHFARLAIELEIARMLAQKSDSSLGKTLLGLVAQQRTCLKLDDLAGFTVADQAFHLKMYEAAGMPDLWTTIRNLSGNLDRLRRLHLPLNNKARSVLSQHTDIANAIKAQDHAAAEAAIRAHLSGTLSELDVLRNRYPDYVL